MNLGIAIFLVVTITACAPMAVQYSYEKTSSVTGCNPQEIDIDVQDNGAFTGVANWIAECQGKKYYCVSYGQMFGSNSINCHEAK